MTDALAVITPGGVDKDDAGRLREAVMLLENPGWAAGLADLVGRPIEWSVKALPPKAHKHISAATGKALHTAVKAAVSTMDRGYRGGPSRRLHKAAVMATGAVGGFFGWVGLAVELPVTTVIMLRSIADIARSEGEDLNTIHSQLACMEVFALGGRGSDDDSSESGYFAVRIALAKAVTEAAEFIAREGVVERGAPVIVRLVAGIATRFGVVVEEKVAAEAVPVVGALGGAAVNLLFTNHFQQMARGHFIVRALERKYGPDEVRRWYDAIAKSAHEL